MNEKFIYRKIMDHDEILARHEVMLANVLTRDEFLRKMDEVMVILKRLEQEVVMGVHRMDRIETRVEALETGLVSIKTHFGIKG